MAQTNQHSLVITRVFEIDQHRLYQAWSAPDMISQWLFPWPWPEGGSAEVENRFEVGGTYTIDMHTPDGEVYTHTGEYLEIVPEQKIVFSWNSDMVRDTRVTVEFRPVENGTKLVLIHDFFPSDESRQNHKDGWEGCLANLQVQADQPA